jgi:DNA-binding LytR/AlgR family response regulator
VNDSVLQLALREMRSHFTDPRVLASMAVIAGILGFSGPFGTFEYLPTGPRIAYWAVVVAATYAIGFFVATTAGRLLRARLQKPAGRIVILGLLIGPPITLAVVVINGLTFGFGGFQPIDWLTLLIYCTIVAMGVNAISEIVSVSLRPAAGAAAAAAPKSPPILDRVPLPRRGKLLALSVADHYVEVKTDRGKTLVLIRLSDAIRESDGVAGIQIHRSHWVALDAVKRVAKASGKVSVELANGEMLPVSRGFMTAARDAGLVV